MEYRRTLKECLEKIENGACISSVGIQDTEQEITESEYAQALAEIAAANPVETVEE